MYKKESEVILEKQEIIAGIFWHCLFKIRLVICRKKLGRK